MGAASLLAALLLSGCTTVTAENPCRQQTAVAGLRKFQVANVGRWCGFAVDFWNPADAATAAVTTGPAHGQARIRQTTRSVHIEYRPNPGYAGPDEFEANLGFAMSRVRMVMDVVAPSAPQATREGARIALAQRLPR